MKNMKHILLLLIALLSSSLFLIACSGGDSTVDQSDTETIMTETTEEIVDAEESTDVPPTETPIPSTETPPPPTNTPEPTPTEDSFAGFQQFNSEAGGISLLYPEGWFLEERTESIGEGNEASLLYFASTEELLDFGNVDTEGAYFSIQTLEWLADLIGDYRFDNLISEDLDLTDPISILNEELLGTYAS